MYDDMSYELKKEILKAARKRNEMFAKWIDLCSSIAFLIILIIALFNVTDLNITLKIDEETVNIITIFTIIISVSFDFIFKSDKYKENVFIVNEALKSKSSKEKFEEKFNELIPLIDELDVARARNDKCKNLKAHNRLSSQIDADKLVPTDIAAMNRQRYIIIVLLLEIIFFIGTLISLSKGLMFTFILITMMILIGVIFMIIDSSEIKRAEKKIKEIYGQELVKKEVAHK